MSLLPIAAFPQALIAGAAVRTAASLASKTFANLLKNVTEESASAEGDATKKPSGLEALKSNLGTVKTSGKVNLQAISADTDALLQGFATGLNQLLAENGIDNTEGLTLQRDDFGKIRVLGDHPQAQQIEALIASQSGLVNLFEKIDARSTLLNAIQGAVATKEQSRRPTIAANQNSSNGNPNTPQKFQVFVGANRVEASFQ